MGATQNWDAGRALTRIRELAHRHAALLLEVVKELTSSEEPAGVPARSIVAPSVGPQQP